LKGAYDGHRRRDKGVDAHVAWQRYVSGALGGCSVAQDIYPSPKHSPTLTLPRVPQETRLPPQHSPYCFVISLGDGYVEAAATQSVPEEEVVS
tara:strand:+ start:89 stop:367 length:279 start_codon:yes stop_codon:yes gene_type:complete